MFGFLKRLFSDNLTPGQQMAIAKLNSCFQKNISDNEVALSKTDPRTIDWVGVNYMRQEQQKQLGYMEWFIRNNPGLIEEDGRIKPQIHTGDGLHYVSWNKFNELTSGGE